MTAGKPTMISRYDSVVVRTATKILVPFMQVFALYVVFHGAKSPGGGFQGGAILGASIILTRFTVPVEDSQRYLPDIWALRLGGLGVLIFAAVGMLPLFWGATFLDYGALPIPGIATSHVRALGIEAVEVGVAMTVCGIMVSIFDDLAPAERPAPHGRQQRRGLRS